MSQQVSGFPEKADKHNYAPKEHRSRGAALVLRMCLLIISVVGFAWFATAGFGVVRAEALTAVAERILAGERFAPGTLRALLPEEVGGPCRPGNEAESIAIISYARASQVLASTIFAEEVLADLERRVGEGLTCAPHRPLLWYLLFWARTQQSGFQNDHLPLLRMSYRLGPHEGWVQALRNPFIMRLYEDLPPDAQEIALVEYSSLLASGLFGPAARSFANAPESARERLISAVERLPLSDRQNFGRVLEKLNVSANIEGVADPEREQWKEYLDRLERIRSLWRDFEPK